MIVGSSGISTSFEESPIAKGESDVKTSNKTAKMGALWVN
jgi:hypothetical protein